MGSPRWIGLANTSAVAPEIASSRLHLSSVVPYVDFLSGVRG
jgi:hypothetical protein